jgi:hypothetical protein
MGGNITKQTSDITNPTRDITKDKCSTSKIPDKNLYVYVQGRYVDYEKLLAEKYLHQCKQKNFFVLQINTVTYYIFYVDPHSFVKKEKNSSLKEYLPNIFCVLVYFNIDISAKKIILILNKCLNEADCVKIIEHITKNKDDMNVAIKVDNSYLYIKLSDIMNAVDHNDLNKKLIENIPRQTLSLPKNILMGGNRDEYFNKYLKYKNKYMLLKYQ